MNKAKLVQGGDGTAIPANYVGEYVTTASAITTTSAGTADADVNNATITLGTGRWEIFYSLVANYSTGSSAANAGNTQVFVTKSDNTYVGNTRRLCYAVTTAAAMAVTYQTLSASVVVDVTTSTTYKLRLKRTDDSGTGSGSVFVSGGLCDASFYAIRRA